MSEKKSIISYFRDSQLVVSVISKYSTKIIFNAFILLLCAIFEVFGVGMLVPVIESVQGNNEGSFFVDLARDVFDYFSINYSPVNLLIVFGTMIVLRFTFLIYQQHLARVLSASITYNLRQRTIDNLLNTGLSYFAKKNIGELVSTIFVSSQNSGGLLEYFLLMIRGVIFCVAYILVASILSPEFTLIVCSFVLVSYLFVLPRFKKSQIFGSIEKDLIDNIFDKLQDKFSGIRTIKIFNQESNASKELSGLIDETKVNDIRIMDNKLISFAIFEPLLFIILVISIIYSVEFLSLPISKLVVSLLVFTLIIPQFKLVNGNILQIKQLIPHFTKVNELISSEDKPRVKSGNKVLDSFNDSLELVNMNFKYDTSEKNILDNIDLKISKNQFIAFVGPSGAGKSSLADIILRNYEPNSGEFYIDNIHLDEIELGSWRSLATIVDQDCYLFNDTISNNIKYGFPEATMEDIYKAAKLSNAEDFIKKLPDGYETKVGNRGTSLSGGERQRVSLARSLIMNPEILILDEATSSLDSISEKLIQESLDSLRGNTTLIVIAHRLSTIKKADKIFFIKDGKITERGNHQDLLDKNGDYKKFIELQDLNG
jgi:ABC-type multidrug transport system fused ATPase/permease subunit